MTRRYWGGYTLHGSLLHLALATDMGRTPPIGVARSACGLELTGGAWLIPEQHCGARCRRCTKIDNRQENLT